MTRSRNYRRGSISDRINLIISVSEELYRRAIEAAAEANIPVEDLFTSALKERLLAFEQLKEKAARGSYEKFERVISKIPAVNPPEYDRL